MVRRLYELLGVSAQATPEEIKRAFRRIARSCHPDVVGDDPEAVQRFVDAREAYETLIDAERRKAYDNPPKPPRPRRSKADGSFFRAAYRRASGGNAPEPAPPGDPTAGPAGGGVGADDPGLDDLFADFGYGGSRRRRPSRSADGQAMPPRRGNDLTVDVAVPAGLAATGGPLQVHYARLARDPGWVSGQPGDGVKPSREAQTIEIPAGTRPASVRRYPGLGDAGAWGGPPGDLIARFRVDASEHVPPPSPGDATASETTRQLDISVVEALLGGRVEVQTDAGPVWMTVPPCTSSGTVFRLKGRGGLTPAGRRGDLLIEARIIVPESLDAPSRALIEAFAALHPESPPGRS